MAIDPAKFRIVARDHPDVEVVGLRAETKFWLLRPFDEHPKAFLSVFDALAAEVRPHANWWRNEDMGEFKPASARAWSSPKRWMTGPKENTRSFMAFEHPSELGAGRRVLHCAYNHAESFYFDSNTPYIRLVLPYEGLESDPEAFLARTLNVAEQLPIMCGHCGYSLEVSHVFKHGGENAAYPIAMKHRGVNLHSDLATWRLRETNALDTVNWLTLVGVEALKILGGRKQVLAELRAQKDVIVHELKTGLVVQAGAAPQIGGSRKTDPNLKPYRAVYGVLRKALELKLEWNGAFQVTRGDKKKKTERWHTRFG